MLNDKLHSACPVALMAGATAARFLDPGQSHGLGAGRMFLLRVCDVAARLFVVI